MKTKSKTNWEYIDNLKDEEIDYTDSPEVTEEMFRKMTIFYPSERKNINIRIKTSTLDFLKKHSKHYQTTINAILDAYVHTKLKKA